MASSNEVYDSMCELAQKLIDRMDDDSIILNEDQFNELQMKINKIHAHMEDFSKKL